MRMLIAVLVSVSLLLGAASAAQETQGGPTKKKVVAGERYRKGGLYRFLFGSSHRDLWTTPFEVEVLDLATFGGGLTATRIVGHGQSKGLAFKGADGRLYTFRPLLKDPSGLLPVELRETFAKGFVQDQMASGHPAGHVVVPPLLKAASVIHNEPRLVMMPDDPSLGEFRSDFKGVVGDIEEFGGSPGIVAAEENIDGEEMWKRLRASPSVRVDSRAYLAARLVDQLVGDWDRHRNQWRWAKVAGKDAWQPIPEDRDQALVKFDGFVISLLRPGLPLLVNFGEEYSNLEGLTFDGWDVDRRLLADLEKPAWDEVAAAVKAGITDAVIEEAVRRMPAEYFAKDGARTIKALKVRRDGIPRQADKFYRFLAKQVDVFATDAHEKVEVKRADNGDVAVSVSASDASAPYYRRVFHPGETSEVRLLLFGGNDRVVTQGPTKGPLVRVVGGDGADVVDDSASGGTRVSDSGSEDQVLKGRGTKWDRRAYVAPPPNRSGEWIPPRDWGRRRVPMLRLTGGSDVGLVINWGLVSTGYGFRKWPYSDQERFKVGFSSALKSFRGVYEGDYRFENSRLRAGMTALASGYSIVRFYGLGNETVATVPDKDYRIEHDEFVFAPRLTMPLGRLEVSLEPIVKYTTTEPKKNPVFASGVPAVSTKSIGQVGAGFRLDADTTDKPAWPSRGIRFVSGGHVYPSAWSLDDTFSEIHGDVQAYLSPSVLGRITLALKGGGKRVWGDNVPYFESAFLGGRSLTDATGLTEDAAIVRGLRPQRYAGDGVLYGSAELRLSLGNAFVLVPGEIGILGFYDTGRVYLKGQTSNKWHHGAGGGLWFASPNRRNSVSLVVAKSEKRTAFYLRTGVAF